jgi:hypothetical protein
LGGASRESSIEGVGRTRSPIEGRPRRGTVAAMDPRTFLPPRPRAWCRAIGGQGEVRVVSDPSRQAYADWGLGRTSLGHFAGRRSLAEAARLARRGIHNRHPHGTRWQSAGTFALDEQATVRWCHLPQHAGDLPDLDAARRALR